MIDMKTKRARYQKIEDAAAVAVGVVVWGLVMVMLF